MVEEPKPHLCPWWLGYVLASPLRRLFENPERLLAPHVRPGMTVLDYGSAMGFFSLPLARLVGSRGRVVCLDVQERMLANLRRRARRKGLDGIIEPRLITQDDPGLGNLAGKVDLIVAVHVLHETENPEQVLCQAAAALRPGGVLLMAEPRGHVTAEAFDVTRQLAEQAGLVDRGPLPMRRSHSRLLEKPAG